MAASNLDVEMSSSSSMTSSTTTAMAPSTQQLPSKSPLSSAPSSSTTMPSPSQCSPQSQPHPPSPTPSNHSLSDADSESSFPSVSSGFFFSSAAHSPYSNPYSQPHSNDSGGEYGPDQGGGGEALHMIIPSLALPEPLPLNRGTEAQEVEVKLIALVNAPDELEDSLRIEGTQWDEADGGLKILRGTLIPSGEDSDSDSEHRQRTARRVTIWVLENAGDNQEAFHPESDPEDLSLSSFFLSEIYTVLLVFPPSSTLKGLQELEDVIPVVPSTSTLTLLDLLQPQNLPKLRLDVANAFLKWRSQSDDAHDRNATYVPSPPSAFSTTARPAMTARQITARAPLHSVVRRSTGVGVKRRVHRYSSSSPHNSPSPEESTVLSPRPRSPNANSSRPKNLKRPLALSSPPLPPTSHSVPLPHNSVIIDPLHLPSLVMLGVELAGAVKERVFGRSAKRGKGNDKDLDASTKSKPGAAKGGGAVKFLFLGFCVGVGVGVWLGKVWGAP
ncbi:hypothetical protein V5O48_000654 [Marasmius crinis-equi]|uniref:Uncharacterized protein n=1 Tax=Marasmius crinis-equi TaxID=585013 RepID=A0ABR3G162_9AGAR